MVSNSVFIDWYPPAKAAHDDCLAVGKTYNDLRAALSTMKAMSMYITAAESAIKPTLGLAADGEYGVITDLNASWAGAVTSLSNLKPPAKLLSAHKTFVSGASEISTIWQQLEAAQNEQKADDFKAAEAKLPAAHERLRQSSSEIRERVLDQQRSIDELVSDL